MGVIRLSGQVICPDAAAAERLAVLLPEHVRLTRAEPGCLSFEVTPTADPLVWAMEESFSDHAAFEAHRARTTTSGFAEETADIRRDYRVSGDP